MGLFGAMTTAVGGLRAQAFALENVSGNIANSQTIGFKRIDTSFADMVPDSVPQLQLAGGVLARSRSTNNVQGDIQNASVNTFMAINGPGYFIVQQPSGFPDGTPVFTGVDLFSRRGDFQLDKDGYLVNGTGYYLKVLRVDGTTGNVVGSVPEVLQFSNDFLPARPTSLIEYRANLATFPRTAQSNPDVPGSERLNVGGFSVNPTVAGTGTVVANDVPTFLAQSIAGGAITMYDPVGSPVNIQMRWAKLADIAVNITSAAIPADVAATGQGNPIPPDIAAATGTGTGTYIADVAQVNTSAVFGDPTDITAGGYIVNGESLAFNFGNGNIFNVGPLATGESLTDLMNAINNASDAAGFGDWVTATISGGNQLVLTATDAAKTFTVANSGAGTLGAANLPVTTPAVNLLTQTGSLDGQTLTIQVGAGLTKTITFGNDDGEIGSLAELLDELQNNGPAGGTVTVAANGGIQITANSAANSIIVGGTASAPNLTTFGITSGTFEPTNAMLTPLFGDTLSVTSGSSSVIVSFGTGLGQVSTRAELMTALGTFGALGVGNELNLTALNNLNDLVIGGSAAALTAFGFNPAGQTIEPTNALLGGLTGELTVELGGGGPFTIAFGANDGLNQVNNRGELAARLAAGAVATGLSLSLNPGGQIVINSMTDQQVQVDGTPATLTALGLTAQTAQGTTTPRWEMFYQQDSNATGTNVAWRNAGVTYTFDASGQMTSNTQVVTLNNVTINGIPIGELTINHGDAGITQFSDVNGNVQTNLLRQNGYPAGNLQGISVNEKGRVIASYSNGRTLEMAEIVLASFNADNSLKRLDGGAFEATSESGPAQYGASGKILAKSLEGSNTDIADEFTKLIVTQQAYAANTRIVTTSDQMLQETLNMVR